MSKQIATISSLPIKNVYKSITRHSKEVLTINYNYTLCERVKDKEFDTLVVPAVCFISEKLGFTNDITTAKITEAIRNTFAKALQKSYCSIHMDLHACLKALSVFWITHVEECFHLTSNRHFIKWNEKKDDRIQRDTFIKLFNKGSIRKSKTIKDIQMTTSIYNHLASLRPIHKCSLNCEQKCDTQKFWNKQFTKEIRRVIHLFGHSSIKEAAEKDHWTIIVSEIRKFKPVPIVKFVNDGETQLDQRNKQGLFFLPRLRERKDNDTKPVIYKHNKIHTKRLTQEKKNQQKKTSKKQAVRYQTIKRETIPKLNDEQLIVFEKNKKRAKWVSCTKTGLTRNNKQRKMPKKITTTKTIKTTTTTTTSTTTTTTLRNTLKATIKKPKTKWIRRYFYESATWSSAPLLPPTSPPQSPPPSPHTARTPTPPPRISTPPPCSSRQADIEDKRRFQEMQQQQKKRKSLKVLLKHEKEVWLCRKPQTARKSTAQKRTLKTKQQQQKEKQQQQQLQREKHDFFNIPQNLMPRVELDICDDEILKHQSQTNPVKPKIIAQNVHDPKLQYTDEDDFNFNLKSLDDILDEFKTSSSSSSSSSSPEDEKKKDPTYKPQQKRKRLFKKK